MNPFKGQVQIGQTYLSTWGRSYNIQGHVVLQRGWGSIPDTIDPNKVWSAGEHFNINTGRSNSGIQLVQLDAQDEKAFWQARIEQIKKVNCADKLKLVEEELATMEHRISRLSKLC